MCLCYNPQLLALYTLCQMSGKLAKGGRNIPGNVRTPGQAAVV